MQNIAEIMPRKRCHDHMHVVGSDNKLAKGIALAVEMPQGSSDNFPALGNLQHARARALIQPFFNAVAEKLMIFSLLLLRQGRSGILPLGRAVRKRRDAASTLKPHLSFVNPLLEFLLRQRIGQPEGHKVGGLVLSPVRQIGLGDVHGRAGIEKSVSFDEPG